MSLLLKPIYLLADSQLLFWKGSDGLFFTSVRRLIERQLPKAAYIGASNGDLPEFYSIFEAAMQSVGIYDCRMIRSSLPTDDLLFLEAADIILLAGGDAYKGWKVFEKNGLQELIVRRYYEGALLIGVSAGAMQLGLLGWPEAGLSPDNLTEVFKLVPFIISAHDEKRGWEELKSAVQLVDGKFRGLGLPTGGGAVYYAEQFIEPIRHAVYEFSIENGTTLPACSIYHEHRRLIV
jgi:peptidase E